MTSEKSKLLELIDSFDQLEVESMLSSRFSNISKQIGFDIPLEIIKLVGSYDEFNDPDLFWLFDSDIYSIDEIEFEFASLKDDSSYFGYFGTDQNFNLSDQYELALFRSADIDQESPDERIKNLARFLPIGRESGDFLIVDLEDGSLASLNYSTFINFKAPSIVEHFRDLSKGVEEGVYKFDHHGELDYPREWEKRVIYKAENS